MINKEDLIKDDARRYEVLYWIYQKVRLDKGYFVDLNELVNEEVNSEWRESRAEEIREISDYWAGEGLIKQEADSGMLVRLKHEGIIEVEKTIKNPDKPTEHFSLPVIQYFQTHIAGNNYGGIQQGGANNTQINSLDEVNNLEQKIDELINVIKSSSLSDFQKITTEGHLQTIQKLTRVEITSEVSQEVESRIVAVKDVLSTTADLVSLGQTILPMIGHFFHIANF